MSYKSNHKAFFSLLSGLFISSYDLKVDKIPCQRSCLDILYPLLHGWLQQIIYGWWFDEKGIGNF